MKIRTRVAPSPTGDPHVGTAYIALFNWIFAKKNGGDFILRIEDTDQARSSASSEKSILASLRWLGLSWQEGPDVGGAAGPYRQSERLTIYKGFAEELVEKDCAFHCFCSPEVLDEMRAAQRKRGETPRYDGRCEKLPSQEVNKLLSSKTPHVIRLKVPDAGVCVFSDKIRGTIEIPWSQVDKQILLKTDGYPTYHMAAAVDDHLMGITHILRGEEWINSVPKQVLLYQYFDWSLPELCHLPLLRNPDKSKLSKRKNPTGIDYYRQLGVLPQALLNYLGTMGWSDGKDREIYSIDEMIESFSLEDINLGGPVFDFEKLMWMNGQYIRALPEEQFVSELEAWALNRDNLGKLVPLLKERTERFSEIASQVDYLLGDRKKLAREDLFHKSLTEDEVLLVLHHVSRAVDDLEDWTNENIEGICRRLAEYLGIKVRVFLVPLFLAISGRPVSLPLFESMAFLGREICRARLRDASGLIGISKKKDKQLSKSYQEFVVKG
tara:strand:+ start:1817 stop:3301 length:1485 start_codon:yes stop_codon:yes gene_type:complete